MSLSENLGKKVRLMIVKEGGPGAGSMQAPGEGFKRPDGAACV